MKRRPFQRRLPLVGCIGDCAYSHGSKFFHSFLSSGSSLRDIITFSIVVLVYEEEDDIRDNCAAKYFYRHANLIVTNRHQHQQTPTWSNRAELFRLEFFCGVKLLVIDISNDSGA